LHSNGMALDSDDSIHFDLHSLCEQGCVVGVGLDYVDVARFAAVMARRPALISRVFSSAEVEHCVSTQPALGLGARFACREAVVKALGVGLWAIDLSDVEVQSDEYGRPTLALRGRARAIAEARGVTEWLVSLTHSDLVAGAVVVALGRCSSTA
jgi:holo-[acyl-carrier protein] synthase